MKRLFVNRYGEVRSGWSFASVIAAMFVLQFLVVAAASVIMLAANGLQDGSFSFSVSGIAAQLLMIATEIAMLASALLAFKLIYNRPFRAMGLGRRRAPADFLHGVAAGVVMISAVAFASYGTGAYTAKWVGFTRDNTAYILLDAVLHLLVGLAEESIARGYLMTAFKATRQKWLCVAMSGLIFAALHLANSGMTLLPFINIALCGFTFALMFIRRGSIWMPIGLHFIWNFLQGSVYGSLVSGADVRPLVELTANGPDWLTGGAFGFEGGIFVTIVMVLASVYILLIPKPADLEWTLDSDLPLARSRKTAAQQVLPAAQIR